MREPESEGWRGIAGELRRTIADDPLIFLKMTPTGFLLAKAIEHVQAEREPASAEERKQSIRDENARLGQEPGVVGRARLRVEGAVQQLRWGFAERLDQLGAWRESRARSKEAASAPRPPAPGP